MTAELEAKRKRLEDTAAKLHTFESMVRLFKLPHADTVPFMSPCPGHPCKQTTPAGTVVQLAVSSSLDQLAGLTHSMASPSPRALTKG